MTMFQNKIQWGVEFLADMLIDSKYKNYRVEDERDTIFQEIIETQANK